MNTYASRNETNEKSVATQESKGSSNRTQTSRVAMEHQLGMRCTICRAARPRPRHERPPLTAAPCALRHRGTGQRQKPLAAAWHTLRCPPTPDLMSCTVSRTHGTGSMWHTGAHMLTSQGQQHKGQTFSIFPSPAFTSVGRCLDPVAVLARHSQHANTI